MDDTPNKALEHLVIAMGGSKKVAPLIWPDKGITEAAKYLCDCLNDERPAKLDFSQVLFILRKAKEAGLHDGMNYVTSYLGYTQPEPIAQADEAAELQRQFIEATNKMADMADRIQMLSRGSLRAAA